MVGVCVANKQQRWWFRVQLGQLLLVYFTVCLDCFPSRFISLNIFSSNFLYHLKPSKSLENDINRINIFVFLYCLSKIMSQLHCSHGWFITNLCNIFFSIESFESLINMSVTVYIKIL